MTLNGAIKQLHDLRNSDAMPVYFKPAIAEAINVLLSDVRENVMGEWIEDNSREKSMMWRCSVCGRIAYYPTIGPRKSYKKHCGYNFCPNCGAEMRGEDNGRDEENHNRV